MTAPPSMSVFIMPEDIKNLPAPENGAYYVVSRDRNFIHKETHFGNVLVEVDKFMSVPEYKPEGVIWKWEKDHPKIPIEIVGKAWHFFRSVWNQHRSEAMVDITWSPSKGYRLFVPKQQASHGGVEARRVLEHYDTDSMTVGTIHSHCDFGAFHSGTDETDAKDHDGIHLTIGHVDKNPPEVAAMIAFSGCNWDIKLDEYFTSDMVPFVEHPAWWNNQIVPDLPASKNAAGWSTHHAPPKPVNAIITPPFGKKNNAARYKTTYSPSNRYILPADWETRGVTLDELLYTGKKVNEEQEELLKDAIEFMDEVKRNLNEMGLDVVHAVINKQPPTKKEAERKKAEEDYYSDAFNDRHIWSI